MSLGAKILTKWGDTATPSFPQAMHRPGLAREQLAVRLAGYGLPGHKTGPDFRPDTCVSERFAWETDGGSSVWAVGMRSVCGGVSPCERACES